MHHLDNNSGSFLAILKLVAQTNDDLQDHLTSPVAKSASKYLRSHHDVREVWKIKIH